MSYPSIQIKYPKQPTIIKITSTILISPMSNNDHTSLILPSIIYQFKLFWKKQIKYSAYRLLHFTPEVRFGGVRWEGLEEIGKKY
jgi:hypothetical protein